MRHPVAFLLFVSLLAIVFPKGNEGYIQYDLKFEIERTRGDFAYFDKNKDNYVDKEEFSFLKIEESQVESAFKKYDGDGDGKMNYEDSNSSITECTCSNHCFG